MAITYRTTSGICFLYDEGDERTVSQHLWWVNKKGYVTANVRINGKRQRIRLQRFLMKPTSGFVVDHKNHNKLDNRRCNLEIVTAKENIQRMHRFYKKNPKLGSPGKGGGRKVGMTVRNQGVVYYPKLRKWRVTLLSEIIGWAATKEEGRALRNSMIEQYQRDGRITQVLGAK